MIADDSNSKIKNHPSTEVKKNHSIVKRVILFPLAVILIVSAIMIISTIYGYINLEKMMVDSEINSIQVSLNQLKNQLDQMDNEFIQYVSTSKSYTHLSYMDKNTPKEEYVVYQAEIIERLENQTAFYDDIGGAFSYYKNIDLLVFRGNDAKKRSMHLFLTDLLKNDEFRYNHWKIVEIEGRNQLVMIKKYLNYYWGCWIPIEQLSQDYGLDNEMLLGTIYIADRYHVNTLKDPVQNSVIARNGTNIKSMVLDHKSYKNYTVSVYNGDIVFGTIIPSFAIFNNSPLRNKLLLFAAFLPFILGPIIGYWLHHEIARPLKKMDDAMKAIRMGELDYQIEMPERIYYTEFDRLISKFNEMMSDINELEFNLYKTKINQQRTELKYISQQIRPHFILNILNLIYSYEEHEFHLVKRMVLYLTDYFRYIVNLHYDYVSISAELSHADNYLKIQQERYPDRFDYTIEVEEAIRSTLIPPLLIQTFLENCMKYAMKNDQVLLIYITASKKGDYLKLIIRDNGNGFDEVPLQRINKFLEDRIFQETLGIGIQNSIERLDMIYQNDYSINIENAPDGGAIIDIEIPIVIKNKIER